MYLLHVLVYCPVISRQAESYTTRLNKLRERDCSRLQSNVIEQFLINVEKQKVVKYSSLTSESQQI